MPLTASDITGPARGTLLDAAAVYWSDADLISYLNEAIRATVAVKPDVYPVRGYLTLTAGTVQVLADDEVALIDITHNQSGGRVVTPVDHSLLQESNRFWPAATQQREVEHFAIDPRDPRRFIVYPPNNGQGSVFAVRGGVPAALTATSDTFPLLDIYQSAMISFVLSRAYAKNTKRQDLAKATSYRGEWAALVGARTAAQTAVTPRVSQSPGV